VADGTRFQKANTCIRQKSASNGGGGSFRPSKAHQRAKVDGQDRLACPSKLVCHVSAGIPRSVGSSSQVAITGAHQPCSINIGNAAVLGLKEELHIQTSTKYNTALTIFFVPYIIFEIPSNMVLKKLKPHVWCMPCSHPQKE
jgi:hypothetical protein